MNATKNRSGAWTVSAFVHYKDASGPHLLTRTFYGYSKREALRLARAALRGGKGAT